MAFSVFLWEASSFLEMRCTAAFLVSSGSVVRPWLGVADLCARTAHMGGH